MLTVDADTMKLFTIFIVVFGVLTVVKSTNVRLSNGVRSKRSLPFLPAFLGGSNESAAVSSTEVEIETAPEVPIVTSNQRQYPVWRVHRYNGVNLTPVSMTSSFAVTSPDSAATTSVVRQPEESVDYAVAGSENVEAAAVEQLPEDLRQVAASLGYTDETAVPSLDDITSILGTGSRDETVGFIKELAETQEGIDLMRDFLTTFQTLTNDDDAAAEAADADADYEIDAAESNAAPTVRVDGLQYYPPNSAETRLTASSRTIAPQFAGFASVLDRTNTDLNLLQRIIPRPDPAGGIFSGLNSFISYLRPPNNTPIPYRPLNPDLEKVTRPGPDRIPIRNLPPVSPIPPIRGIPNLPAVQAIPPLHLPQRFSAEPIAANMGPTPINGYIQLNRLPPAVNRFAAQPQPINFQLANRHLTKLPLADVRYGSSLSNSNLASEFSRQPPLNGLFVTRTNSVEGDYQAAASEPKVFHVEAPPSTSGDESTNVSRIEKTFSSSTSSSNDSYNDVTIATKPQRVAGVRDDAYANGRIHKADPSAIDLPILVHAKSNAHQPRNLALSRDDEEEERKFIETVAGLTSGQIRDTKEVEIN